MIISEPITNHYESRVRDYVALLKPRVMSLVVFTGLVGLLLADKNIHPFIAFVAIVCMSLGAGSAAAINMWYDRDIDAKMYRTRNRPLVLRTVSPDEALSFGVILGFFSVFFMAICVNLVAASLLLTTILYYIFVYTAWLKRTSPQNVVIGGVAGALPPMIGYAAVTNSITIESIVLFIIIFMWTPPHSWALALYRIKDYTDCSVPMMPVAKGERYTLKQTLIYSILTVLTSLAPYFLGMSSIIYLGIAAILGVGFLYYSISLLIRYNLAKAKQFFFYSIFYLFCIFLGLLF